MPSLNDIFGIFGGEMDKHEVIDVKCEDITPPKLPKEEIVEDWTNGNPNRNKK